VTGRKCHKVLAESRESCGHTVWARTAHVVVSLFHKNRIDSTGAVRARVE
jgi:hypothetical protein